MRASAYVALLLVTTLAVVGVVWFADDATQALSTSNAAPRATLHQALAKGDGRPTVIVLALDGVRAANAGVCGYDRPTTPVMRKLQERGGALVRCDVFAPTGFSPGAHASLLTGVGPLTHGVDAPGMALPQTQQTLAAAMRGDGYQAALVSSSAALSHASGLLRDFDPVRLPRGGATLRGDELSDALRRLLPNLRQSRPLFLYAAIGEATPPLHGVPEGHPWLEAGPAVQPDSFADTSTAIGRFLAGKSTEREVGQTLRTLRNSYDQGVHAADATIERVMQLLRREGWLKPGYRLIVLGTHGTFLGEHGVVGSGCHPGDHGARVPLLYVDTTQDAHPVLPSPMSTRAIFELALHGQAPEATDTVHYTRAFAGDRRACVVGMSRWDAQGNLLRWSEGAVRRTRPDRDPSERRAQATADPTTEALGLAYDAWLSESSRREPDGRLLQQQRRDGIAPR